jgi:N6-adenosine-specific RNA methylase IME4
VTTWEGLSPPYSTIVADPPWHYDEVNPPNPWLNVKNERRRGGYSGGSLAYGSMSLDAIKALPVGDLGPDARLFLWTTNRYLRHAWDVAEAWGFAPMDRLLVWCKPPRGTTPITTEFVLLAKRGRPERMPWSGTTWFDWPRERTHSAKPPAFLDLVESWCPGPYVELFARAPRLGWDSWGKGYETGAA